MKVLYADTNIFLRHILQDNPQQARISESYFKKAKDKVIKLVVISEILPEIEYTLRKVYKEKRENIASYLESIVKAPYLEIEQRSAWIEAISLYLKVNTDLVDAVLYIKSREGKAKVLSFDRDFKKLLKSS